ncbi:MAG: hypothetical protein ACR2OB_09400 [Solirubrobacteraceae bacterium]
MVVVGGGFAGLQAVRGLRGAPVDVTLIDRRQLRPACGGRRPVLVRLPVELVAVLGLAKLPFSLARLAAELSTSANAGATHDRHQPHADHRAAGRRYLVAEANVVAAHEPHLGDLHLHAVRDPDLTAAHHRVHVQLGHGM